MSALTDRLPFELILSLRTHFGSKYRALSLLTLVAMSTSVALASALEIASRSVEAELRRTADSLAGSAQLEVTGGDAGVPEALLEVVLATSGVRSAAPLIERTLRLRTRGSASASVRVLGVDVLNDSRVRRYVLDEADAGRPLKFLTQNSIVVAAGLAARLNVEAGEPLHLLHRESRTDFFVHSVLRRGGVSEAYAGNVAIVDIFVLQALAGERGLFDRIDVVLEEGVSIAEMSGRLSRELQSRAHVRPAASRNAWVDEMVSAVRVLMWTLLGVGVVVASLLSYSTISISVDRRMRDFALLRSNGLESSRVRRLVTVDALVLGILATLAGAPAGALLARVFISGLSRISVYLQNVETNELSVDGTTIAIAAAVGLVVSVVGSVEPGRRAANSAPLDALRTRATNKEIRKPARTSIAKLAVWIALWTFMCFGAGVIPALVRLPSVFLIGIVIVVLATQIGFPLLLRNLRPALEASLTNVGRFVGTSLLARPVHTSLTVATVGAVLAGVTVVLVVVTSLSSTLDKWTSNQYPGGVFITAGSPLGGKGAETISAEVLGLIRSTPGVLAVFDHYTMNILYQGQEILIAGGSMDVMARLGRLPAVDTDPVVLAHAIDQGGAAVSEQFSRRFGVLRGDHIVLRSPAGPRKFVVVGQMRDYAGPGGSINIDIGIFDELWRRRGSTNAVIWVSGPIEPTLSAIMARVGDRQDLHFVFGDELSRYASKVIGQFTSIVDVVVYLTALLGGIAVMNLLLTSVIERKHEMALLWSAGATSRQLVSITLLDGLLVSIVAAAVGIALGLACAYPMVTEIVRSEFHWWVDFSVAPWDLVVLGLGVVAAAVVAGAYPALRARDAQVREALAPE